MCCAGFLKCMMFIFNGTIFLAGAAILGVGIWMKVDGGSLLEVLPHTEGQNIDVSQLVIVSYVLMGLGSFLLIIGFLGCCGAVKESKCMLLTFFCIVLLIFLIEVAAGVLLFVFRDVADDLFKHLEGELVDSMRENYGKEGTQEQEDFTNIWNSTMTGLECCGITNYTNFIMSPFVIMNGMYPPQCCNVHNSTCNMMNAQSSDVDGCLDKLVQLIKDNIVIVAGVALGIAALEIAAMVVSMVLYCNIKSKRNRDHPYRG